MKVIKDGNVYKVAFIDGKYYAWSKTGGSGDAPTLPDTPDEPDVPTEPITLVGNTKIENSVLSGFDANSYAIINYTLPNDLTQHEFEISLDFTMGNDATGRQAIFDTNRDGVDKGWWIALSDTYLIGGSGNSSECSHNNYRSYWGVARINNTKVKITNKDSSNINVWVTQQGYSERLFGTIPNITPEHGIIVLGKAGSDITSGESNTTNYLDGTFNLSNCYIEIDGVKVWEGIKSSSEPDVPTINSGVELVGNLQNNNNILSGFDASSYAVVNYKLPETFTSFEFVLRCTMPNFSYIQGLFSTNFEDRNNAMTIGFSSNTLWVGCNGVATSCSISGAGVEYWWKYVYDGSTVKSYRKTETSDYELLTNMNTPSFNGITGTISIGIEGSDVLDRYNRGTYNLDGCYIKVDGVTVWEGVTTS